MNINKSLLDNEINKLNDLVFFYKKVLYSIDLNNENIIDHIRNIRHYRELLEDKIDDLNNYAILKNTPVCKEQVDRDEIVQNSKNLFNQFMVFSVLNNTYDQIA